MGCRTRANEYYSEIYYRSSVNGSAALKREEVPSKQARLTKHRTGNKEARQQKIIKAQKIRFTLLGMTAGVVVIFLCAVTLRTLDRNSTLSSEVSKLENQVESLTVYNDAREYEINNSVDLNEVIAVATQELGMVRSSASQIVYFSSGDSEYIQQVASVPVD